ncbi:Uma2 family endonuclease [Roseofilum sp. BLCC_M154]|uniref:Uma2 family endonuclease n=1 Tax=Roseofilum acuticapitatum BLCC-M154 TaxID=3022444 RepID=A0ABT7AY96_9CYAN|nr:Uma2 family endonuclease [Roseofilum acuticapitatum BLCC-M154]
MPLMTIKDLEKVQANLQQSGQDYRVELEDGKIIVMGPSDIVSSEIGSILISLLITWVYPRRLGRVFDSSGGFILPNSDLTAPDVSFVRAERLKTTPRYFGDLVPDLVVEIKSQSDRIKPLEDKLQLFLSLGSTVGLLIDPDLQTVTIYRSNAQPIILRDQQELTLPELLPGWSIQINQIWPPIFTDE